MLRKQPIHSALMFVLLVAWLGPRIAGAQNFPAADAREISAYALTEAGLTRYTQALKNLGQLEKKLSGNCDDSDGATSLNDSVAKLNAVAAAQAAVRTAGMTSREYVVFSLSLFQTGMAAWALDQPGGKLLPGVSKANVDFYRKHAAAIQKLKGPKKSDDCDGDRREDDSEG